MMLLDTIISHMPSLPKAIIANPEIRIFKLTDSGGDDPLLWMVEPADAAVLSEGDHEYFVISALHVRTEKSVHPCYMNVCLPERICDYAFFIESGKLRYSYVEACPGKVLPSLAIDCSGSYDMFFAKHAPEVGIEVLQRGLALAKRKRYIAQDLGYIYRDLKRYRDAIEMFKIVLQEDPSPSKYTYLELAAAYRRLDDKANQEKYIALSKKVPG